MPLFSRNSEPVQAAEPVYEQPPKKHGIFSSHRSEVAPAPAVQPVQEKHGLFGSRRQEAAPVAQPVHEERPKRHGLFGRSPSPSPSSSTRNTSSTRRTSPDRDGGIFRRSTDASSNRGILHRSFGNGNADLDPSIVQARERVMLAEGAEREADRALVAARESVREAHDHVRRLELEAEEEARRAKIKQHQARDISKRGKQLGRKCNPLPLNDLKRHDADILQAMEFKLALCPLPFTVI